MKREARAARRSATTKPKADPKPVVTVAATDHDVAEAIRRHGEEIEQRYVAARDAWSAAMRAANSGRAADLASLAIAQEAFETAAGEREEWLAGGRTAIPVNPEAARHSIEVAVEQELEWRRVLAPKPPQRGILAGIRRRLSRR
jgi:hypothetical protein